MTPYFGAADTLGAFVNEQFSKLEDRSPDKWNDLLKNIFDEGKLDLKVLLDKKESRVIQPDNILIEQMREKRGGQIVETIAKVGEK